MAALFRLEPIRSRQGRKKSLPSRGVTARVARCLVRAGGAWQVRAGGASAWNREEVAINLRQLAYFRQVVEAGSISAAASRLNLAQPALGSQIRQLESELGAELLVRHSRGVTATNVGQLLYRHALRILEDVDRAASEVRELARSERGKVRLGISPSMVRVLGPDLLIDRADSAAPFSIGIVEERTTVLLEALRQGQLDIAFLSDYEEQPGFEHEAVVEEDLLFVTAADKAEGTGDITFAEALTHDLAIGGERSIMRRIVEREARRLLLEVRVTYEVHSITSMKALVVAGSAATIMPYSVVEPEIRSGQAVGRRIVDPGLIRAVHLVRPRQPGGAVNDPAVQAHIEGLSETYLARLYPWARRLVEEPDTSSKQKG